MGGRVRPKTLEGYENLLRRHAMPRIGAVPLAELTPLVIQELYTSLMAEGRLQAGTVLNLHLVLTQALGQAVRWGMIGANPVSGAQPPRPRRKEPVVIDEALAMTILSKARGTQIELAVVLALSTGMRRGEILGLCWSDFAPDLSVAHVRRSLQAVGGELVFAEPKTRRSRRSVPLGEVPRASLAKARAEAMSSGRPWERSPVVPGAGGGPMNPGTLSSAWRGLVRRSKLPAIRFHDLRHGHATLMLIKGVHPKVVSERLGHASIGITLDTYSHVLPTMQAEAVAAFDELIAAQGELV